MSTATDTSAILIDTTLCTGCNECVKACKKRNDLGKDQPRRWKRRIDDLSSTRFTTVVQREEHRYVRQFCRHCVQPACVSACLVGALQKTPEGPVVYDSDLCMGCRYCMMSCPFGIPRYDWEKPVPYIRKCDMCRSRILEGKQPACIEACTPKAAIFGKRGELLEEARRRIDAGGNKYLNQIYGDDEAGGTSVIYISDIPLEFLNIGGQPGDKPLPELTWAALVKVPPLAVGVAGLMGGVWWITQRRMKLAAEAAVSSQSAAPERPADEEGEQKS